MATPTPNLCNLNPAQSQAVMQEGTHLLIVAGPGTGKTHTLTQRIARFTQILKNNERILTITFTNKAAQEMQGRLANCGEQVVVGTFHQFALKLVREYSTEGFRVADPDELASLAQELWPEKPNSERKKILEDISQHKSARYLESFNPEEIQYQEFLKEKGLRDFDDLLLGAWRLLNEESVRKEVLATYRYIFVDEYQDINPIQHALLKQLVTPRNLFTAIGDPNQAIYGFRGSDVRYFSSFVQDFPGAVVLTLCENYRSAPNLLLASGQIMAKTKDRFVPELTAKIYEEGRLTIHEAPTDKAEAEYVVHQIEQLVGGTSMFSQDSGRVAREQESAWSFGDIAVLYRLNGEVRVLKEAFERSGIPYSVSAEKKNEDDDIVGDVYMGRVPEAEISAEKVSLMTLHAAKGLEFPVVFIVGCEENILPLNLAGMTADLEEERRLFYVGMTRAKEVLYLVRAKKRMLYGKTLHQNPSPFLADIEEELKEYEKATARRKNKNEEQLKLF